MDGATRDRLEEAPRTRTQPGRRARPVWDHDPWSPVGTGSTPAAGELPRSARLRLPSRSGGGGRATDVQRGHPTFGRPVMVDAAVRSVLDQVGVDVECIVVDDAGSEPLDLPADDRLKVVRRQVNGGTRRPATPGSTRPPATSWSSSTTTTGSSRTGCRRCATRRRPRRSSCAGARTSTDGHEGASASTVTSPARSCAGTCPTSARRGSATVCPASTNRSGAGRTSTGGSGWRTPTWSTR